MNRGEKHKMQANSNQYLARHKSTQNSCLPDYHTISKRKTSNKYLVRKALPFSDTRRKRKRWYIEDLTAMPKW